MTITAETSEAHVRVDPISRQIRRNIERKAKKSGVRCRYCPLPVLDATTAVLANGHVAHTSCVERIDTLVDQINHDRASERLEAAGIVFAKPNLIVP